MDSRNTIHLLILLFYTPTLLASSALCFRHGWRSSWETWLALALFALTRLISASLHLSTITHPDNLGLRIAATTIALDALSPLLLCAFGLLRRLLSHLHNTTTTTPPRLTTLHLRLLELATTVAAVCASVAYRSLSRADILDAPTYIHSPVLTAAASLYVVALAGLVAATASLVPRRVDIPAGERRVLAVLVASLPLLLLRTLYTALDVLAHLKPFSAIGGDVGIWLGMAVVEEAGVCVGYLGVGWTVRVVGREEWERVEGGREKEGEEV